MKSRTECFYVLQPKGLKDGGENAKKSKKVSGRVQEEQLKIPHSLILTFMCGE